MYVFGGSDRASPRQEKVAKPKIQTVGKLCFQASLSIGWNKDRCFFPFPFEDFATDLNGVFDFVENVG